MDNRTYSKQELKRIIDRALRLQATAQQEPDGAPREPDGHSLADLIAVGRELGVDEEQIRRAAREVEQHSQNTTAARFAGGEISQTERSVVPYEITRDQAEELAVDLDRVTHLPGQASVAGRRVSWQSSYLAAQQHGWSMGVSVAPRNGETVVEVEGRNGMLAGGIFGGLVGGVGIGAGLGVGFGVGIGALGSPLFAAAVPIAFVGASYVLARALFRAITRSRRRRLATITEQIRQVIDESRSTENGEG